MNPLSDWRRDTSVDTYCSRCGRLLVLVIERQRGRRDPETGGPVFEEWLQCPKWPRNGLVYLFRGNHDCLSVDHPMTCREYR